MLYYTKQAKCKAKDFFMLDTGSQRKILDVLETGGLILMPTDTIWGISCDATNPEAIEKVYELKQRERDQPLIILVDSLDMLRSYVEHVHPKVETLLEYHKRPLTIIYEKAIQLPYNLVAQDQSVAARVVLDPVCKDVISAFGKPIVSTSANISGMPFPRNFGEISSAILQGVDFVAKIKQSDKELYDPSIIVRLDDEGEFIFIRE